MRKILFLLLLVGACCFGQSADTVLTRQQRVQQYYEKLAFFNSSLRALQAQEINPFEPDYAQPGGGSVFQVFVATKAGLQAEANFLGLRYDDGPTSVSIPKIRDGWYEATVRYSNSNTYTRSTYTLNVEVQADRVVKIDFGNGGSVHSGYNNSGYYYSGGNLNFQYDFNGNIIGATTRVTVQKGSAYLTYDVEI